MNFRDATPGDAPLIAACHVESWRSAYAHFMDPAYLAGGIEAERLAHWTQRLTAPSPTQRIIIAEEGAWPIGFTCLIGADHPRWGTLVDNLHALPAARGKGLGSALLAEAARWALQHFPQAGLYLWCYADNHAARGFYAHRGGLVVENTAKPGPDGRTLPEQRFHWADPAVLLKMG
ncbi:GNAT family N-acetyltransferase [Sphingobium estronivorans]|uniref:GNAT family N-acetyltransferase n=1 Tax=Sphingobium estronivorans TaxID=1577690 RepID=UPI00123BF973|nr:GNAT family N-acetyltransferase [Sphingobium estronivorans]